MGQLLPLAHSVCTGCSVAVGPLGLTQTAGCLVVLRDERDYQLHCTSELYGLTALIDGHSDKVSTRKLP